MKRESNLDLLRAFCCIAIVLEHACGAFLNEAKNVGVLVTIRIIVEGGSSGSDNDLITVSNTESLR